MKYFCIKWTLLVCLAALLVVTCGTGRTTAQTFDRATRINADERVVFFPTAARLSDDGESWRVPVHGWIFEPETNDFFRFLALRRLRTALELEPGAPTTETFDQRVRLFLVDSERRKRIAIRIGEKEHALPASDSDGHFTKTLELPVETVDRLAEEGRLRFKAVVPEGDARAFAGLVHLIPPTGVSVISDLDDTIKVTEVGDRKKLIDNTFYQPFRPVDGMASLYRRWSDAGAQFHFVSSSPWQLYETFARFAADAGFPDATYHLNRFRITDSSFVRLFEKPLETKLRRVESILTDFPKRRFVLVGDSGQQDPELYGMLARDYPDQVVRIFIRDVTDEAIGSPRYQKAFKDLPRETWQIFDDPATLRFPKEEKLE